MVEPCQSLASRGGGPDLHSAKFHIDTSHSLLLKSGSSEGTQLRILSGDAEIFGRPVRAGDVVDVPINRSFNIETQKRAEIEVMSAHRDVHSVLTCPYSRGVAPIVDEILRFYTPTHTPAAEIEPLTVLLCGNTDSGKSTLFTYISNWMMAQKERTVTGGSCACKGASIILVDGDLGQGSLSIPGTLAAMEVSDYIDPWAPFPKCAPFATYFFGGLNFGGGQPLRTYTLLCQKLQGKVHAKWRQRWMNEKLCSCPRARRPLILINTMGWIASTGFRCLQALGRVFRVNGIIGLGTTHDFVHTLAMSTVSNVQELNARFHFYTSYEKQTGIARRSSAHRQVHRTLRLNAFFTGTRLLSQGSRVQFRPLHIVAIPWSDVQFFAQREIQQKYGPSPRSHVHQSAAPADEKSSINSLLDSSLLPFESYLGIKLSFGEVASLATCVCAFVRIPAQLEYRNKCGTENHGAGEACDVPCDALAALLFGFLVGCDRGFVHMALATQLEPNALPSNTIVVSRTIKVSPEMYTLSKTFLKKAP